MKIALGADHAGFELKERLRALLVEAGHEVVDCGVDSPARADYPDQAALVADAVARGQVERGVLVCGTGAGMAIAANKFAGVRAVAANDLYVAGLARSHNDANVLALGARVVGPGLAEEIVHIFLATAFAGGRHLGRVEKIAALEATRRRSR